MAHPNRPSRAAAKNPAKHPKSQAKTLPKNLKKLVRARMERTGESYTTARKAILDGRPEPKSAQHAAARQQGAAPAGEPAPEELPEYPAPQNVRQYDAALWHRILTQSGVKDPLSGEPLSEAMLAGLAGGIGFMLHSFVDADTVNLALVTRAHPEPFTATLLERCGAKVRIRTTGNQQAAAANLDAALEAGRAIAVRVTRAALPWVATGSVDAEDTIDVAVLGELDGMLLVDDGSGELQQISDSDLAAARARHKRDRNFSAWVPSRRGPRPAALAANVREAIAQTTGRMLGTTELPGLPQHYARNFGVSGMRRWAERLADTTGDTGWATMLAEPALYDSALEQLHGFFADSRFAAADGLRGLYAQFLQEASALPGLGALAQSVSAYTQLAADWEDFTAALLAPGDGPAPAQRFTALAGQLAALADAEQAAATQLDGIRASLPGTGTGRAQPVATQRP